MTASAKAAAIAFRRSAFFIATNRLTVLDAAVTRPGRFDLQVDNRPATY